MPLLFKNGKLVINDIDQLVFSDDPDSCRCCPGACECADGSSPRYISQADNIVSGVTDTYQEQYEISVVNRLGNGGVTTSTRSASLSISGLSALNGTWPARFYSRDASFNIIDCPETDPTPTEACYLNDIRAQCEWAMQTSATPITGTISKSFFLDDRAMFPQFTPIEESYSCQINGFARCTENNLFICGCVTDSGYSSEARAAFNILFTAFDGGRVGTSGSVNGPGGWNRFNRCDAETQLYPLIVYRFGQILPRLMLPALSSLIALSDTPNVVCANTSQFQACPTIPEYSYGYPPWLLCSDTPANTSNTYDFVGCSKAESESGEYFFGLFGNIAYDASWSYSHSALGWTHQKVYTVNP